MELFVKRLVDRPAVGRNEPVYRGALAAVPLREYIIVTVRLLRVLHCDITRRYQKKSEFIDIV